MYPAKCLKLTGGWPGSWTISSETVTEYTPVKDVCNNIIIIVVVTYMNFVWRIHGSDDMMQICDVDFRYRNIGGFILKLFIYFHFHVIN
ncbi:hypothetical protein Hanom_Chr13g01191921 [Helianthus anomalus]